MHVVVCASIHDQPFDIQKRLFFSDIRINGLAGICNYTKVSKAVDEEVSTKFGEPDVIGAGHAGAIVFRSPYFPDGTLREVCFVGQATEPGRREDEPAFDRPDRCCGCRFRRWDIEAAQLTGHQSSSATKRVIARAVKAANMNT